MKERKTMKIDYSSKRLGMQADKYYNEGKYLSALRLAYRQYELYGGDGEVYTRLADIYEGMGLHASANNWWYRFLDIAEEEDLPDIYEGLAVNYLNMGREAQSAYYYNRLIEEDETLPEETKMEIVDAFSKDKRSQFQFVYPPELADYSKELDHGSRALKAGDCKRAIYALDKVAKGSKDYAEAKEMQAVAYLLDGNLPKAREICEALLKDEPNDVRVLATLAAIYIEEGRKDEAKEIALALCARKQTDTDELYKVATVCCENGLHEQAYEKFREVEKQTPYDGRTLYFKAVSAYKCGRLEEAEKALDTLCTIYPDAEVAKYFLKEMRLRGERAEAGEPTEAPEYFYHLPQAEREERCRALVHIGRCPKDEAQLFGLIALHDGYFRWCFDELDGTDHDLQYLALVTAEHVYADEFLREVMLDCDVSDVLKLETLRLLYMRNEDMDIGVVLCDVYRRVELLKLRLGRKKRKRFLESYAKIASKFVVVSDWHAKRVYKAAQALYDELEERDALGLVDNTDDCACAIFVKAGLKELGSDLNNIAEAFAANAENVRALLAAAKGEKTETEGAKENEADRL